MKSIAFVWQRICIASLMLSTIQPVLALALSTPHFHSGTVYHCSPFMSCRRAHDTRPNLPHHHVVVRNTALQLAAAGINDGDFFNDDSGGGPSFFEDKQKPASRQEREEEDEPPLTLEELEMLATPFDEHLPKLNTVTLVGRVGNEPEPRYFDDGKVVLNLSLAVRRKYHPLERKVRDIRSGDEETDWFPLVFWGRDAEYVTNYVEKGSRIGVTGSLVMDGWMDKMTGEQRRKAKILVRHIDILESRAEAELRKGNKQSYDSNNGGRKNYNDEDDGGPSPAGTGGFFS